MFIRNLKPEELDLIHRVELFVTSTEIRPTGRAVAIEGMFPPCTLNNTYSAFPYHTGSPEPDAPGPMSGAELCCTPIDDGMTTPEDIGGVAGPWAKTHRPLRKRMATAPSIPDFM